MTAKEIISEQAIRAFEVTGNGLNDKKREHFKKFFEEVCLRENWVKIEQAVLKERGKR